jgi:hypothetical protein
MEYPLKNYYKIFLVFWNVIIVKYLDRGAARALHRKERRA